MAEPIISVRGLSKQYRLGPDRPGHPGLSRFLRCVLRGLRPDESKIAPADNKKDFWALKDITFDVAKGERVGIIGRNGAGKSTLLKILSRVTYPTEGEARIRGRVTSLLEVGTGFNDDLTGRENIYLNASLHGLERAEIDAKLGDIIEFSGIAGFIDTPVKHYSSGMSMRLAFSVAAHLDPDVLFLDEVLAVGDLLFQQKCLTSVGEMTRGGRTLIFVSHSMDAIMRYCDRCIWLDDGKIVMDGSAREVTEGYVRAMFGVRASYSLAESEKCDDATLLESVITPVSNECSVDQAKVALPPAHREEPSAFLVRVEARNAFNEVRSIFRLDEAINICFEFDVVAAGIYVPSVHVFAADGQTLFVSLPPGNDSEMHRKNIGRYVATATIPSGLLNCAIYDIGISVWSPEVTPLKRHFYVPKTVSFQTVEAVNTVKAARGVAPREFPGYIRPVMEWRLESFSGAVSSERQYSGLYVTGKMQADE